MVILLKPDNANTTGKINILNQRMQQYPGLILNERG